MSREAVDIIRTSYEAFSGGDWDAAFEVVEPEFELVPPAQAPVERLVGAGDVKAWIADLWGAVGDVSFEVEQLIDANGFVVAFIRLRTRPSGADAEFEQRIAHLWSVHGTKLIRCQIFLERAEALEAAGLSAQDAERPTGN
jgi:ketosteroid isomerase-like protein